MAAVRTRGLARRFGARTVVDGVSMTVPKRSVYGFLGRNGAGKTTTLKMLLGLLKPSGGAAEICGVDVVRDRRGAARKVGALLEAHGFYPHLTGREALDLTRTLLGLSRAEIDRVLDVVEMRADAGRRVADYSLGMRQRLGIARALLGAPPLLVLDEPTNGLDPDGIADMRGFLKTLPERSGATVLLSSHLLGEIEQVASHVGILSQGRLVVEGELARLKDDMAPEVVIRIDDPARARQALNRSDLDLRGDGMELVARLKVGQDADAATAWLNRTLVQAGVAVFAIAPRRPSLETLYNQVAAAPTTGREMV